MLYLTSWIFLFTLIINTLNAHYFLLYCLSLSVLFSLLVSPLSILWHLFVSSFHTCVLVFSLSFLWPLLLLLLSICPLYHLFPPSSFFLFKFLLPSILSLSFFTPPASLPHPLRPSLPAIGKWRVARVPAWTVTPLGTAALPGPNSLALVVMWTSSRLLPWQQHLHRSPPSTSIRKMDKPPLNASLIGELHSRDRPAVSHWAIKRDECRCSEISRKQLIIGNNENIDGSNPLSELLGRSPWKDI